MFDDKFESLSDEAMSLRITEKLLTEVERSLLREAETAFDVSTVKEHLRSLNPKSGNVDESDRERIESALREEYATWRSTLVERDEQIETFHVRRFCDSATVSLDPKIFQSLTRFYRSIPLTPNSLSKFDLMSTRAFASECRGRIRPAKFERDETCEELRLLYLDWSETQVGLFCDTEVIEKAVNGFDEFLAEAERLSEFEGLIESDIFERLRVYKRSLGPVCFVPECVAAAIDCNINVGRVFDSLMVVANSNLNQRLGEKIDFAGALLDGSLEGAGALLDIFAGFMDQPAEAIAGNSDMALLRSMLKRTEPVISMSLESSESSEAAAPEEVVESGVTPSVKERIAAELESISQPEPDTGLLRLYMSRSAALDVLDLNDFLFDSKGDPDVLGRRALASILCLEEFKDNELANNKPLEPDVSDAMIGMLNFAERIGDDLTKALQVAEQNAQNRLLVVSNSLLSSRLQVERAVVRFTSPVVEAVEDIPVSPAPKPEFKTFEISRSPIRDANRWLIAATVIVVLLCGSMLLFSGPSYNAAPLPEDVEEVNLGKLPAPEYLSQAFRKANTLFVTAKASWAGIEESRKKKILQQMVELELRKPLNVVIVIGPEGLPFADLTADGPKIHGKDQIEQGKPAV